MKMKKYAYLLFVLLKTIAFGATAQFNNPFEFDTKRYNSKDIMIVWSNPENTSHINQQILGFDWPAYASEPNQFSFFEQTPVVVDEQTGMNNPGRLIIASADINGDAFDDILIVFRQGSNLKYALANKTVEIEDGSIYRDISLENPSGYETIPIGSATGNERGLIQVISGDFDGDGTKEFALIIGNSTLNKIQIIILDSDGTLNLQQRASIADEDIVPFNFNGSEGFSALAADLNGNGKDEIVLMAVENNTTGSGDYATFIKVYEVSGEGSTEITPRARLTLEDTAIELVSQQTYTNNIVYTQNAIAAVGPIDESATRLVAGLAIYSNINDSFNEQDREDNFFFFHLEVSSDLNTITVHDELQFFNLFVEIGGNPGLPLLASGGDLNGNGIKEAVFYSSEELFIIDVNDDFELELKHVEGLGTGNEVQESNSSFAVGDITKDGRDNIIVFSKTLSGTVNTFTLNAYVANQQLTDVSLFNSFSFNDSSGQFYRSFALDIGNYDGDDFFLGEGTLYQCDYYKPVMIIGAPPVHWDKIDGVVYDVNNCFSGGPCNFGATFSQTTTDEFITSVELTSDWAVSGEATLGFSGFGFTIGASVGARYGEQFSNLQESTITLEQNLTSEAVIDDRVHFFRIPVDVWEYPVKNNQGEIIDYVLGVFPTQPSSMVLNISTTKALGNYRPHHEPGNILSYPVINSITELPDFPEDPQSNAIIFEGLANITYSVSGSNSISLSYSETFGETSTSSWNSGVTSGFSISGWGLGLNLDGEYNEGAINISGTSVSSTTKFEFYIGNIMGPDGEYNYAAQPLIYWSRDGAGIVTYRVTPLTSGLGTFWEDQYSTLPDPALNLPWKNDVFHSNLSPDDPKVDRTKSMFFSNSAPLPDDTVTVFLTVLNYSLVGTGQPVEVEFFNGNPDEGGILLADINNETIFSTGEALSPRGRKVVEMDFVFTLDMYQTDDLRIYARLDPDNKISEIHTNNNQGWSPLGLSCGQEIITSVSEEQYSTFMKELEVLAYPNPVTDELKLVFHLARRESVNVRIFDMTGRMVQDVVQSNMPPGEIRVFTNISNLPAGLYLAEVIIGNHRKTAKIIKK
ncbi:MAG: T9SS C-terminal target domain-containing protein [Bacteroidetes bacterium]|nr:MAG: T9SS C-terminal target domain-containing protein [Bacteroidota bacterium]